MGIIDIHHHFLPPAYVEAYRDQVLDTARGFEHVLGWTPQRAIEMMDEFGIETAVVSISAPGFLGDRETASRLARVCNEYGAEMVRDHPGRFQLFAALPMPHVEDTLEELSYALDELGAVGAGLMTSYQGRWLGDPEFDPVHEALSDRRSPAFVHPVVPSHVHDLVAGVPDTMMEFSFDTARAVASLIFNGAMGRHSGTRWVFSHGGGAIPMLVDRLAFAERFIPDPEKNVPNGVMHEIRRCFYDVGNVTHPIPFAALRNMVGIEQLVFNTDYPFPPPDRVMKTWNKLALSDDERAAIESGNARRLLSKDSSADGK